MSDDSDVEKYRQRVVPWVSEMQPWDRLPEDDKQSWRDCYTRELAAASEKSSER